MSESAEEEVLLFCECCGFPAAYCDEEGTTLCEDCLDDLEEAR
jgi:hypothetical protein